MRWNISSGCLCRSATCIVSSVTIQYVFERHWDNTCQSILSQDSCPNCLTFDIKTLYCPRLVTLLQLQTATVLETHRWTVWPLSTDWTSKQHFVIDCVYSCEHFWNCTEAVKVLLVNKTELKMLLLTFTVEDTQTNTYTKMPFVFFDMSSFPLFCVHLLSSVLLTDWIWRLAESVHIREEKIKKNKKSRPNDLF